MLVSLFTDASRCHDTGASGYGYWAKSARKRVYGGGPIRMPTESTSHAEIISVANGLYCAIRDGVILRGDNVLIQNDNMHVVCLLDGHTKGSSSVLLVLRHIIAVEKEHNLILTSRHIKGHTSRTDPRYKVNALVDDLAKRGMLQKRQEILNMNKERAHGN